MAAPFQDIDDINRTYDESRLPNSYKQRTLDNRSLLAKEIENKRQQIYVMNMPIGAKSLFFKNYSDLNDSEEKLTYFEWK